MSDTLLVYVILAATIALFMSERLRLDVVALLALLALMISGVLTPAESLAGFSDPVVIMIAALFVVAGAMLRTGLAERFGGFLGRFAGGGRRRATAVVMLGTGLLSAFMSTTGTVALMLPVVTSLAHRARLSPSLMLMPLAISALLGGLLTLIATPPNIIVANQLVEAGYAPFSFFDFTPVGLVLLGIGILLITLFGGRVLPARAPVDRPAGTEGVTLLPGTELVEGYELGQPTRLRVSAASPLIGTSPAEAGLRSRFDVNVVAIHRPQRRTGRMDRLPRTAEQPVRAGDELDVHGPADAIEAMAAEIGLEHLGIVAAPETELAEVLLTPRSRLVGETLSSVRFRSRNSVNVLSVRRQGQPLVGALADIPLRFADTLLVAGTAPAIERLRNDPDFVVVARTHDTRTGGPFSRREIAALLILVGMLVLLAFELLPAVAAVLVAAVAMVLTGCLHANEAYREINWESVVLIAAILPMATALQKTGGVDQIVALLGPVAAVGPIALLAAIYVLTGVMGLFISNTATAALVAPVALGAAVQLGVSPYPVLMTVAIASSAAFSTPVSTPANMLVLGPGAYRFRDYVRVGVPLQVIIGIATLVIVPLLFPF
ncbi:MAG TPA: SLC13 family permease [Longimicrobiales bacterium]|nr:SLC13 family permease [Longimicrobiales bacterium]